MSPRPQPQPQPRQHHRLLSSVWPKSSFAASSAPTCIARCSRSFSRAPRVRARCSDRSSSYPTEAETRASSRRYARRTHVTAASCSPPPTCFLLCSSRGHTTRSLPASAIIWAPRARRLKRLKGSSTHNFSRPLVRSSTNSGSCELNSPFFSTTAIHLLD